jgi:threonylcarbamoyladenosine tRNA methylthiotransferase MtaB
MHNPRICRQLHLPLQSGCDRTLRRMGRPYQADHYAKTIAHARETIPNLAITTDIMVGFPGETEDEFEQNLAFIEAMDFADAHVFIYSPRPKTAAENLPHRVPIQVARQRSQKVRQLVRCSAHAYRNRFIGEILPVLWETAREQGSEGWELSGLTDNYLRVHAYGDISLLNVITGVRLTDVEGEVVRGEVV